MDIHYKEKKPEQTVMYLKSKLQKMGLETDEISFNSSRIGTNSIRVVFKDTYLGANGKGVNKSYCTASAYAELFERFSNNYINPIPDFREHKKFDFKKFPDEKYLTAYEIVHQNNDFITFYFEKRNMLYLSIEDKVKAFESINIHDKVVDEKKFYLCVPFFDVRNKTVTYLPYGIYIHNFGSNGMAAGNTSAEALVQGLSEIIERYVQREIITKELCLPDVPDEEIQKYPYVFDMYQKAKTFENLKVYMKDCSLGGVYPVAGLLLIEKNTGKYGLKLGCHPDFGIAMERTLTEATQGGEITEYANRSCIDFSNESVRTPHNLMNSFATGKAQYPYQCLFSQSTKKFSFMKDVKGLTNEQIIQLWVQRLLDSGYDVLVRNNSWLDFPAFHIVIPRMSEAQELTDKDIKAANTRFYISNLLKNPNEIGKDECRYISSYLEYAKGNILIDNIKSIFPFQKQFIFNSGITSTRYLSIMCDIYLEDYEKAYKKMSVIMKSINKLDLTLDEKQRLLAEWTYLSAFLTCENHELVMTYMNVLFSKDIIEHINTIYSIPENIFVNVLPTIKDTDILTEIETQAKVYYVQDSLMKEMSKKEINQDSIATIFVKQS